MALLEVDDIGVAFGGLVALDGVSFEVEEHRIKGVIGPNGAGKTTLFNVASGILRPGKGEIRFLGQRVTGLRPFQIARLGVSRTFQTPNLFLHMTVAENVMVGRHCRTRSGVLSSALRLPRQRREERRIRDDAMRRLAYVGLDRVADEPVGSLSFGRRRMVELARGLATEPKLLLLDEPASGLNTKETDELADLIRKIRDTGVTVLLVEHDMSLVMDVCEEIVVLDFGRPIAEGDPASIRSNPRVVAVYLGGELEHAQG
jgi:branched-chain amino acid transport system ATP-binding protein